MKIAIVTAVWKRHEIFELFAKGIHELEKINRVEELEKELIDLILKLKDLSK